MINPKIGVQLYTLRDHIQNYEDTDKTFKFVKDIGSDVVQISGIGPVEPEKVAELVNKYLLDVCVTHKPYERMQNDLDNLIAEHKMINCDVIGMGSMPEEYRDSLDSLKKFIKETDEIGKRMYDQGVRLGYHNHSFEFAKFDGKTMMDILLEETNPEYFTFIPDVYWMQVGGVNPADYLKKLKGRVKVCHFKDLVIEDNKQVFTEIDTGNIDLDACFRACQEAEIPYIVYEQDTHWKNDDSFTATEISFKNLQKIAERNKK